MTLETIGIFALGTITGILIALTKIKYDECSKCENYI